MMSDLPSFRNNCGPKAIGVWLGVGRAIMSKRKKKNFAIILDHNKVKFIFQYTRGSVGES